LAAAARLAERQVPLWKQRHLIASDCI
jgi:hypothetical protein